MESNFWKEDVAHNIFIINYFDKMEETKNFSFTNLE